jgi:predicted GNAT family N-acyltransferase
MKPDIELHDWPAARSEASTIRYRVFVEEQHVPAVLELDAHDPVCLHALARTADGYAVGTGRLLPATAHAGLVYGHIGRMAVLRGDAEIVLSAQTHAVGFYASFGFAQMGETYIEAGIPHQDMRKSL